MDYSSIFDKYVFSAEKAVADGFELLDGKYVKRIPLEEDGFYAVFCIGENSAEVNVYEEPDGELYLPFNTKADGGFVSAVRAEVDAAVREISENCFLLADVKAVLLDYVHRRYGTVEEAPWDYLEEYHTLKTAKRRKWYGIFMLIPYTFLGVKKDGKINVLNLKMNPGDIPALIDYVHFFPAYHMNKKYWISILLDREADIEQIKKLLDDSYEIVERQKT